MTDKITMVELFSGVGAQERALRQLGIPYEIIATCDCDANAVLSYAAMRHDLEVVLLLYFIHCFSRIVLINMHNTW
jgi:site-specific DNA-cytosine methylase